MREVSHSFTINLPREAAWEKLRDLTLADQYVPSVHNVTIDTDHREGDGVRRTVFLNRKPGEMQETVVEWNEGYGFLLKLTLEEEPIAPIFAENYFRYAITEDGDNTKATLSMSYEPKGFIGGLIGKWFAEKAFSTELKNIGENMKALYES